MARKIIILDRTGLPSDQNYRVAFWLDVVAARQAFYANAGLTSQVKDATQGEIDALRSGAVVEEILEVPSPAAAAQGALLAAIVARYNARQAEFTARNPFQRYGSYWDGTSWTGVTVA